MTRPAMNKTMPGSSNTTENGAVGVCALIVQTSIEQLAWNQLRRSDLSCWRRRAMEGDVEAPQWSAEEMVATGLYKAPAQVPASVDQYRTNDKPTCIMETESRAAVVTEVWRKFVEKHSGGIWKWRESDLDGSISPSQIQQCGRRPWRTVSFH